MSAGHEALRMLDRLCGPFDEFFRLMVTTSSEGLGRHDSNRSFAFHAPTSYHNYLTSNNLDPSGHPRPVFRHSAGPGHSGNPGFQSGSQAPEDHHRTNRQVPSYPNERPGMGSAWIPGYGYGQSETGYIYQGMSAPSTPPYDELDELFQSHIDVLAQRMVNIQKSEHLLNLKRACLYRGTLPSRLNLYDICLPQGAWLQPISGGSFSDVYQAYKGDRTVALKVLRTHQINDQKQKLRVQKNFISEVLIWASCQHRYVLPLLGVDAVNFRGRLCMVLPWMKNEKILDALKLLRESQSALGGIHQVNTWILQITEGSEYLHTLGIIHGDMRAANVLLDEHYNVKLADFGLSLIVNDIVSQATTIERTPNWIAPELLNPEKFGLESSKPTMQADVYAFGCVAIELYTGKPPYAGLPSYKVITKVMNEEPIPIPLFYGGQAMSPSMWTIISQCLSHDPSLRPDAHSILNALRAIPSIVQQSPS